jgi:hypothetical protein
MKKCPDRKKRAERTSAAPMKPATAKPGIARGETALGGGTGAGAACAFTATCASVRVRRARENMDEALHQTNDLRRLLLPKNEKNHVEEKYKRQPRV